MVQYGDWKGLLSADSASLEIKEYLQEKLGKDLNVDDFDEFFIVGVEFYYHEPEEGEIFKDSVLSQHYWSVDLRIVPVRSYDEAKDYLVYGGMIHHRSLDLSLEEGLGIFKRLKIKMHRNGLYIYDLPDQFIKS